MYVHEAEVDHHHHQHLRSKAARAKGWIMLEHFWKHLHSIGYPAYSLRLHQYMYTTRSISFKTICIYIYSYNFPSHIYVNHPAEKLWGLSGSIVFARSSAFRGRELLAWLRWQVKDAKVFFLMFDPKCNFIDPWAAQCWTMSAWLAKAKMIETTSLESLDTCMYTARLWGGSVLPDLLIRLRKPQAPLITWHWHGEYHHPGWSVGRGINNIISWVYNIYIYIYLFIYIYIHKYTYMASSVYMGSYGKILQLLDIPFIIHTAGAEIWKRIPYFSRCESDSLSWLQTPGMSIGGLVTLTYPVVKRASTPLAHHRKVCRKTDGSQTLKQDCRKHRSYTTIDIK